MSNNSEALDEAVPEESAEQKPVISTLELLAKLKERILANTQAEGIPTGFPILDEVLGGGLFAGLYFLGAISSLGKTTLTCQIADQIAAQGQDVLIFSLEMSHEELLAKSLSRLTGVIGKEKKALSTRQLLNRVASRSFEEEELIKDAFSVYEKVAEHIIIHEGTGDISVKDIREIVEEHIEKNHSTPVVIIDYIQILAPYSSQYQSDKQNIDKTVVELKRISRDFQLPVFGISSLNRSNYEGPITMSAFKESGGIEYSADVLIGLQFSGVEDVERGGKFDYDGAKQAKSRDIDLKILKNRNGPVGYRIKFLYYPKYNYFMENQGNQPNGIAEVAPIAMANSNSLTATLEGLVKKCLADPKAAEGVEAAEGAEAAEGVEAVEGAEAAEDVEAAEDAEAAEDVEATEGAEAAEDVEATEGAEAAEDVEAAEGAEAAEGVKAAEGAEAAEGVKAANGMEAVDGVKAANGMEAVDGADDVDDEWKLPF